MRINLARYIQADSRRNGVIDTESMRNRRPHKNALAAFSDFSTLTPGFKNVRFQDPCEIGQNDAKKYAFTQKSVSVWMAP